MATLFSVLDIICARGFLRQMTALATTSREVGELLPMGTAKQVYDSSRDDVVDALTTYLAYWEGNSESHQVLDMVSTETGLTPLQCAVQGNRLGCVELLTDASPAIDVNKFGEYRQQSPLHLACYAGFGPIVRVLASVRGIKVNGRYEDEGEDEGPSPLYLAAKGGHAEVVSILVGLKGINLYKGSCTYDDYTTPLDIAMRGNRKKVTAILLEAIEKRQALNAAGLEVFRAAQQGNMSELGELAETWRGNEDVLDWIHPIDDEEEDDEEDSVSGLTHLLIASSSGHTHAVQLLWENLCVNPVYIAEHGAKWVCSAAQMGLLDVLRLVLSSPHFDKAQGSAVSNALMLASQNGHTAIVRELCAEDGIDVNLVGVWFLKEPTALDVALSHGNDAVAVILRAAGAKTAAELRAEEDAVQRCTEES